MYVELQLYLAPYKLLSCLLTYLYVTLIIFILNLSKHCNEIKERKRNICYRNICDRLLNSAAYKWQL